METTSDSPVCFLSVVYADLFSCITTLLGISVAVLYKGICRLLTYCDLASVEIPCTLADALLSGVFALLKAYHDWFMGVYVLFSVLRIVPRTFWLYHCRSFDSTCSLDSWVLRVRDYSPMVVEGLNLGDGGASIIFVQSAVAWTCITALPLRLRVLECSN